MKVNQFTPQQRLDQARQEIATRFDQMRPAGSVNQVDPKVQQKIQEAGDTYQKLQTAFFQQNDPWQQANISRKEWDLWQASASNPQLAQEMQTHAASIHQLLMAQSVGVSFEEFKNLIATQGAMALLNPQLGGQWQAEQMAQSLASLESAQAILQQYDQTLRQTPSYQKPKDAAPVEKTWKDRLRNVSDAVKNAFGGSNTQGATSSPTADATNTNNTTPPPVQNKTTAHPKADFGDGKPHKLPSEDTLRVDHGLSRTEAIDAHRAIRELQQTQRGKVTVYLRDDGSNGDQLLGAAAQKMAQIGRDNNLKLGQLSTPKMKEQGLFVGPDADGEMAKTLGKGGGEWIKATFDFSKPDVHVSLSEVRLRAPENLKPVARKTVDISGELTANGVKDQTFRDAEQAAKDLFDSGKGATRATIYLFDRDLASKDLTEAALARFGEINKQVGLQGAKDDREHLLALKRHGLFLGEGDQDAEARRFAGKQPTEGVVKAVVEVKGWPPKMSVERLNL